MSEQDGYFRRIKVVPICELIIAFEKSLASVRTRIAGLIGGRSPSELAGPSIQFSYFLYILLIPSLVLVI